MGFDKPTRTGGDYPDLKRETENGPRLLAFRVLDFLPPEDGDFPDRTNPGQRSRVYPVLCDVMIIDGPRAGTVYRRWTARYAITNALRGAGGDDPTPTTRPGAQIAVRAERPKRKGQATGTVYGNEPSDVELVLIESEFARFGGWDAPTPTQRAAVGANGQPREPVGAASAPTQASGSGARRPFGARATAPAGQ